jgi:S-adenosylmethionine decarboxylase
VTAAKRGRRIEKDAMRQNALLRSGKRTAARSRQKSASAGSGSTTAADRRDAFVTRDGARYAGVHLIIDLHGAKRLNDLDYIETVLRRCAEAAGATLLHIHLHRFQPDGVSGVAVLAESHISIHTWPEAGYAALDVFMCGKTEPNRCVAILRSAFAAKQVDVNELLRGQVA